MSELCNITQPHYLRALLQLLPPGYAWEWNENSAGRRVLAVIASELHRVHELLCRIARYNIERFAVGVTGWSAPDYERLLLDKFGITATATVTDNEFCRAECGSSVGAALYGDRYSYIFTITVDNLSVITPTVIDYLRQYKQSHTALHIRERSLHWQTDYDIHALDVGNAACGADLYTHDYHSITVSADETWCGKLSALSGFAAAQAAVRDYTLLLCDQSALSAGTASVNDPLYADDWHITERVQTHINYKPQAAAVYG